MSEDMGAEHFVICSELNGLSEDCAEEKERGGCPCGFLLPRLNEALKGLSELHTGSMKAPSYTESGY